MQGGMVVNDISIRGLDTDEWKMLRDFRLQALKSAPGAFALSHDECARAILSETDYTETPAFFPRACTAR